MMKTETKELMKLIQICHENLQNSDEIKNYLKKRKIDEYLVNKYKIGFFPQNLDILSKYVNFNVLREKKIIKVNNTSDFNEYHYLVIPVFDEYGEPVGISGRTLLGDKERGILGIPKYKNSSYQKTNILYGLNHSFDSIIEKDCVFVVEGYFDQISFHKNGVKNSVAICGTAFSKNHLLKLRRLCKKIYIILDNDEAGIRSSSALNKKFNKYSGCYSFLKCIDKNIKDIDDFFNQKSLVDFKKYYKVYHPY